MSELKYLQIIRNKFGWEDFPFSLDIIPEVFAGKEKILNPIKEQLLFGNIIYIEGNYGSGKSQILRHLYYLMRNNDQYSRFIPLLIQEPVNTGIIIHAFQRKFDISARISLISDLTEELESIVSRKQSIIMLIDEAQELTIKEGDSEETILEKQKTLQWIRVLSDFRGCRIFLAGLTNFGKKLNEMFRPLEDRVTLNFYLKPLDLESTIELIKERIRYFAVDPKQALNPFSDESYEMIYKISGGYPRAILKICQEAIIEMINDGRDNVDAVHIKRQKVGPKEIALSPTAADVRKIEKIELEKEMKSFPTQIRFDKNSLTFTEEKVLKFMANREDVTPQDVAAGVGITPGTAANILRKLKDMHYLFRKKQGRTFSYTLYSVYRREFTEA
ncbi:MAG: AAA family ATPase [Promethearchaeota archaeon]